MWRPEGWKIPTHYIDLIDDREQDAFDSGADAMLGVLKSCGRHTDGKSPTLSISVKESGWLVFIPDS